ncbi:CD276 antigen-like isoform X2 [Megalops cyprinoides]|uniref:CD276 antigen-like isoform X2 n=1 Tax=Megalops cyprinoides TaxID=118141 RepID=UPI0018654996|nr:CD276 antigen-like isoform X2 [Megalops cyprinoides]
MRPTLIAGTSYMTKSRESNGNSLASKQFSMFFLVSVWFFAVTDAFEVIAPKSEVIAARGLPVVLGCRYTPNADGNLDGLVVTWQRVDNSQVVHSFYYNQDQLDRQSPGYRNRTALYHSGLGSGNASLRLERVRPQDSGGYQCSVSNLKGTGRATVNLTYAAFYTEPALSITLQSTGICVQYESEGYPEPEVQWVDSMGQNLTHHLEVIPQPREEGLLFLRTHVLLEDSCPAVNFTFSLKNRVLDQELAWPMSFSCAGRGSSTRETIFLVLFIIFLLLFICLATFLVLHRRGQNFTMCFKEMNGTH